VNGTCEIQCLADNSCPVGRSARRVCRAGCAVRDTRAASARSTARWQRPARSCAATTIPASRPSHAGGPSATSRALATARARWWDAPRTTAPSCATTTTRAAPLPAGPAAAPSTA
jgi:hypothetical protein